MKQKDLSNHYANTVGAGYVVSHHRLHRDNTAKDTILQHFGQIPSPAIVVRGYSLASLIEYTDKLASGKKVELPTQISPSPFVGEKVYSADLIEHFPYLAYMNGEIVADESDDEKEYSDEVCDSLSASDIEFDEEEFDRIEKQHGPIEDEEDDENTAHVKKLLEDMNFMMKAIQENGVFTCDGEVLDVKKNFLIE